MGLEDGIVKQVVPVAPGGETSDTSHKEASFGTVRLLVQVGLLGGTVRQVVQVAAGGGTSAVRQVVPVR